MLRSTSTALFTRPVHLRVAEMDENGNVGKVDKTWTWRKDDDGNLRIVVHHSSTPYG